MLCCPAGKQLESEGWGKEAAAAAVAAMAADPVEQLHPLLQVCFEDLLWCVFLLPL